MENVANGEQKPEGKESAEMVNQNEVIENSEKINEKPKNGLCIKCVCPICVLLIITIINVCCCFFCPCCKKTCFSNDVFKKELRLVNDSSVLIILPTNSSTLEQILSSRLNSDKGCKCFSKEKNRGVSDMKVSRPQ